LLIGAARRRNSADRVLAIFRLDALELEGRVADRLLPAHFFPRVGDLGADHRLQDSLLVSRVAPGEATLHAGMAAVRLAVFIGHHANELFAAHFRFERAADAAIRAGSDNRMLRLTDLDDALFVQSRRRAGLHASTARYALRTQEAFAHARRHAAIEAAACDGQRKGALHFFASAHAA